MCIAVSYKCITHCVHDYCPLIAVDTGKETAGPRHTARPLEFGTPGFGRSLRTLQGARNTPTNVRTFRTLQMQSDDS